ncbi:hypothetical protein HDV00_011780 [Rhizophlyctis rosea]|nr:hypothetical protein HDV00_011780 [Rhizophlyctis rosea]
MSEGSRVEHLLDLALAFVEEGEQDESRSDGGRPHESFVVTQGKWETVIMISADMASKEEEDEIDRKVDSDDKDSSDEEDGESEEAQEENNVLEEEDNERGDDL